MAESYQRITLAERMYSAGINSLMAVANRTRPVQAGWLLPPRRSASKEVPEEASQQGDWRDAERGLNRGG